MKNSVEIIEEFFYKLCMFEVTIYGSTDIFCNNWAVCVKTTWPELTLSNKHQSIAYHRAQEVFAMGTVRV